MAQGQARDITVKVIHPMAGGVQRSDVAVGEAEGGHGAGRGASVMGNTWVT